MKYSRVCAGFFLVVSLGNSSFIDKSWVSRYSDSNITQDETYVTQRATAPTKESKKGFIEVSERPNGKPAPSISDTNTNVEKFDTVVKSKTPSTTDTQNNTQTNSSPTTSTTPQTPPTPKNTQLKKYVEATGASGLIALYKRLDFEYIWLGKSEAKDITKELFNMIKNDKTLPPTSNSKKRMKELSKKIKEFYSSSKKSAKSRALIDIDVSKLYLNYAYYKIYGGINWTKFEEKLKELTEKYKVTVGWEYHRPPVSPIDVLVEAIGTNSLKEAIESAEPKRFKYKKLQKKLAQYLKLAQKGGWKNIPKYSTIKPNQTSPIIPKIRARLKLEDEAKKCATPSNPNLYDKCLQKAVFRYKIRHGLKGSKTIDSSLRRALNTPISKKIAKIRLNLDRIKWLYRDEEPLRIELNIPSFRLNLYDKNKIITTIRVVTGKANHPTPIFHNKMRYVVVNPYWKIPESIVKHEMLRHLIKDPYYYERRGKILKKSWDENSPRVDPGTVNWRKYYKDRDKKDMHIPYYFMQIPSSRNALGKIKFLFPNKYSVYIHDTPSKRLFFRTNRAFSHGCMRIQKPRELLKMLALYNDNIDVEAIMEQLGTTEKETITLQKSVPVDITYLTAFVDDYGNLHFRRDVYNYDKYQFNDYKYPELIGRKSTKKSKPKKDKKSSKN